MTSLTVEEFELLHNTFEGYCTNYFLYHTLQGKIRNKICYQEQNNAYLKGSEMKLFFLLSYLKNYPLQQFHASYFGVTQGKVSQHILYLSETYEGTVHDKKICDIEKYSFPEEFILRYDLGYVGYNPENATIEKPHKTLS